MKKVVQTALELASQKCPCHDTNSSCANMNFAEQYKIIIHNFFSTLIYEVIHHDWFFELSLATVVYVCCC